MMIETAYSELQNECLIDKTTADKGMSWWNGLAATKWSYKKYCFHKKCVKTQTMIEAAHLKPKNELLFGKTTVDKVTSWWNIVAPKNWRQKECLVPLPPSPCLHQWGHLQSKQRSPTFGGSKRLLLPSKKSKSKLQLNLDLAWNPAFMDHLHWQSLLAKMSMTVAHDSHVTIEIVVISMHVTVTWQSPLYLLLQV
jgi:hypothetical protein